MDNRINIKAEQRAIIERAINFLDSGMHTIIARDTMANELRKLLATAPATGETEDLPPLQTGGIDANKLEAMAKERPDECFLKGGGVLKLIGAIRQLEAEAHYLRKQAGQVGAEVDSDRNAALRAAPAGQHEASRAVLDALRCGIPLQEPVYIAKALLAGREARLCLSGGTGPVSCVMLCNIQIRTWADTPETAKSFAEGYNMGVSHYRDALIGLAEKVERDAASRSRAEGGHGDKDSSDAALQEMIDIGQATHAFTKPPGWVNLLNPGQNWEDWTREQGPPTTKGWKIAGQEGEQPTIKEKNNG
jgi:hypothetical protein